MRVLAMEAAVVGEEEDGVAAAAFAALGWGAGAGTVGLGLLHAESSAPTAISATTA